MHFKSIGGSVTDNTFVRRLLLPRIASCARVPSLAHSSALPLQNHTAGIFITIMPGWLEGPVGLRDVVVGGNTFMSNEKESDAGDAIYFYKVTRRMGSTGCQACLSAANALRV